MLIEGVVADANVLLSAAVGKAALRVITEFKIMLLNSTPMKWLSICRSWHESTDCRSSWVEMQWKLLPLTIHPLTGYRARLSRAIDKMKRRDPEDAHALALAWSLDLSLWSNDRDFENIGVECYSTARFLRLLAAQAKSRQ